MAERVASIDAFGVGGIILRFRGTSSPWDVTENSIRLFRDRVAPELPTREAA